jgi:hypothetical protein
VGWEVSTTSTTCSSWKSNFLSHRTPYAILDDQRRIVAVLAGRPFPKNGVADDWDDVVVRACAAIEAAREEMQFAEEDCEHRRGSYYSKAYGWSLGNGQPVCAYICNSFHYASLIILIHIMIVPQEV